MKKILSIIFSLCLLLGTLTVSVVSAEGWNPDVIDELTQVGAVSVTTLPLDEDENQTPVYVKFTPSETGYYITYSEAETDTYARLYNSEYEELCYNDDYFGDGNYNFCLYSELTGGEVYYIEIFNYAGEDTFDVVIEQVDEDFVYDDGSDDDYLTSGDYKYQILEDGTVEIKGYTGSATKIEIPATIEEMDVSSIGDMAFAGCESLEDITIPDSVTSIGSSAFNHTGYYNNKSNWVNNVLYIDKYLISGIKYSDNETSESVVGEYNVKQGTVLIADYAFAGCEFLELVNLPDSLVYIGNGAFSICDSLSKVEIPDSVIKIGDNVFSWCISLDTVKLGNGITEITDYAFFADKNLSDITMSDSITSIGENAFTNCDNLKSIEVPASVKSMGMYTMGYYQVTSVEEFSTDYRKYSDFSIKGYTNSEAEKYANDNGITFIALDGENPTQPTEPTAPSKPDPTNPTQPTSPTKPTQGVTKPTVTTVKPTSNTVDKISFKAPKVKAKSAKGKISLTLKKVKGTAGYQVRYKVNGKWKVKTFKIKKNATKLIKNLKKGTYKVQIRLIDNAKKPLSNWSKVKTVKVK